MTEHTHTEYRAWCYRCELSRDEARVPEHVCDDLETDWAVCAPPWCQKVHHFCTTCGERQDDCALDDLDDPLPL